MGKKDGLGDVLERGATFVDQDGEEEERSDEGRPVHQEKTFKEKLYEDMNLNRQDLEYAEMLKPEEQAKVEEKPPRQYIEHPQIRGPVYHKWENTHQEAHAAKSECDEHDICDTLGPLEYQEAINEALDALLEYALHKYKQKFGA